MLYIQPYRDTFKREHLKLVSSKAVCHFHVHLKEIFFCVDGPELYIFLSYCFCLCLYVQLFSPMPRKYVTNLFCSCSGSRRKRILHQRQFNVAKFYPGDNVVYWRDGYLPVYYFWWFCYKCKGTISSSWFRLMCCY